MTDTAIAPSAGSPPAPDPNSDQTPKTHRLPRIAGLIVSVASAGFVFGLLAYLFFSAQLQNTHFSTYASIVDDASCAELLCHQVALEKDLQQMRSARVGYALIYRFSLAAAAIIVSLATIVLGAVLVFDRVQSAADNVLTLTSDKYSATITSTWPGLVMVGLGSLTLCVSIVVSGPLAPRLNVVDLPVFLQDANAVRNTFGVSARVETAVKSDDAEPPQSEREYPSLFEDAGDATLQTPKGDTE